MLESQVEQVFYIEDEPIDSRTNPSYPGRTDVPINGEGPSQRRHDPLVQIHRPLTRSQTRIMLANFSSLVLETYERENSLPFSSYPYNVLHYCSFGFMKLEN